MNTREVPRPITGRLSPLDGILRWISGALAAQAEGGSRGARLARAARLRLPWMKRRRLGMAMVLHGEGTSFEDRRGSGVGWG
ncbi:hypothetical protein D9M71_623110 [compost metagenome]